MSPDPLRSEHKYFSILFLILFFGLGFFVTEILNTRITNTQQDVRSRAQQLSPIQEAACTNRGGECQTGKLNEVGKPCNLTDGTPGTVYFNLCPSQTDDIRCCVPSSQSSPDPTQPNVPVTDARLTVKLQGIGPNQNIQNTQRSVTIKIFQNDGVLDTAEFAAQDTITYDPQTGNFVSTDYTLGALPSGEYQMVIQLEKYLDKQLVDRSRNKVIKITSGVAVDLAAVELRAGDISPLPKGDNTVDIIDYNALIGCLPGAPPEYVSTGILQTLMMMVRSIRWTWIYYFQISEIVVFLSKQINTNVSLIPHVKVERIVFSYARCFVQELAEEADTIYSWFKYNHLKIFILFFCLTAGPIRAKM